ncbi:hypothetical protein BCR39DRAFT_255631 [Naematelia encephala]|uniref:Uncharacterized protein n=1 Tax=Naematelia encephala TaxID=71784 RepID=A0A1Y2AW05_9TREE|nr:hypothetical protein BCR39DRAFT_255631 [Naematelia encephala]
MATRAPFDPYALPNLMRLSEADEEWYKPRYRAIQDLVHEMEDENNIIAFKISQIRHRLEMRQEALASQPIERSNDFQFFTTYR